MRLEARWKLAEAQGVKINDFILREVGDGVPIEKLAKLPGFPTVYEWFRMIRKDPELMLSWEAARQAYASRCEYEIHKIVQSPVPQGRDENARDRLRMSGYQWLHQQAKPPPPPDALGTGLGGGKTFIVLPMKASMDQITGNVLNVSPVPPKADHVLELLSGSDDGPDPLADMDPDA